MFEDSAQLASLQRKQGVDAHFLKAIGTRIEKRHELWQTTQFYNSILRNCNHIDFDDQILLSFKMLSENPTLLSEYQKRATHLLVDEYQDINNSQFELIRLLSSNNVNGLFAVGDDDQSIYSFRGGSPEFIRAFKSHFGDKANVLEISCCRRCPPTVLNGALFVVSQFNPKRLKKVKPSFVSKIETPILIVSSPSAEREAIYIAEKCSRVTPSHDVLILVPYLSFAKPILAALRKKRVAYDCRSILAEEGFISLDVLGRWLSNPNDNFALRQTIQSLLETDKFGIPSKRVKKPEKIEEREKSLSEISNLWNNVINEKCSLFESLKINSNKSKLLSALLNSLEELLSAYQKTAREFLSALNNNFLPWGTSEEMFQEISTWIDEVKGRGGAGQSSVRLMSMRLAKGLEADYIFVVGLEQNVFPRKNSSDAEVEEASRLLFVSMTRAKLELNLCHSRTRSASATYLPNSFDLKPSPFLSAIPKEYYKSIFLPPMSTKHKKE